MIYLIYINTYINSYLIWYMYFKDLIYIKETFA